MVKAVIEAGKMREMIDIVSSVVDDAKFTLNPEGLIIRAVNAPRVIMVEMELKKEAFKEFKSEELVIGVDLKKLKKIFSLASGEVKISINKNKFKLEYNNVVRNMPLLVHMKLSDPRLPNLKFGAILKINKKEIDVGIKTFSDIGESIDITITDKSLEMSVSDSGDSAKVTLNKELIDELECAKKITSSYALDYFIKLIKNVGNEIIMSMGNSYPLRIDFEIAGGNGNVSYIIAPRVEVGENENEKISEKSKKPTKKKKVVEVADDEEDDEEEGDE